jgi:hypothetical protein
MWRFSLLATAWTLLTSQFLSNFTASWSEPFHKTCLSLAPAVLSRDVLQSLICGAPLSSSVDAAVWKQLGLVHLLVVSGGHLVIVDLVLMSVMKWVGFLHRFPKLTALIRWAALSAMMIANQFAPPIWRAYLAMALREPLRRRGWTSTQRGLAAFWLALSTVKSRGDLMSLSLSAICAWVLTWPRPQLRPIKRLPSTWRQRLRDALLKLGPQLVWALLIQTLIWWGTWPLIASMGAPHPLATMSNLVLAPLLGLLLLPLALLALFVHADWIQLTWESIWSLTQNGLQLLASALPLTSARETLSSLEWALLSIAMSAILILVMIQERSAARNANLGRSPRIQLGLMVLLSLLAIATPPRPRLRSQSSDVRHATHAPAGASDAEGPQKEKPVGFHLQARCPSSDDRNQFAE